MNFCSKGFILHISVYAQYEGIDSNIKYKTEAFDLWNYLCSDYFDPQIRCRIDLSGFVDEAVLKRAVMASLKTIPMIGCSFSGGKRRPRWIDKDFTGNDLVRVVKAGKDADADIVQCLFSRINSANGPQLQIFVIRKQKGDTLCVVISHMVCDAAGLKEYIYFLSQLYTQMKNEKPVTIPPFNQRGIKALFANLTLKEKLKISLSDCTAYVIHHQRGIDLGVDNSDVDNFGAALEKRIISPEEFSELKHFAKSRGATVNDCFMALFARAFCKNTNTDKIALPTTIDLRKYIPLNEKYGISNYSGACVCRISVQPEDTLTDTLLQVSNQMNVYKSDKNILKSILLWNLATHMPWHLLKYTYPRYSGKARLLFTNLGIIDQQQLNFDGLNVRYVYMTAPILPRPYLQLTASTYNDYCTLGCNIYGSKADKAFILKILDDMQIGKAN